MTINIFVLKGDLNGKIVVVRFFFCRVYYLLDGFSVVNEGRVFQSTSNGIFRIYPLNSVLIMVLGWLQKLK